MSRGILAFALLAGGCTLSPLRNRIDVGNEPYVVFVADGPGGQPDLFALRTAGGEPVQFTFSPAEESAPVLDPTGSMVAFLLRSDGRPDAVYLAVINLVNLSEREVRVPAEAGIAVRPAWSADGRTILVETENGTWGTPGPPGRMEFSQVATGQEIDADSAFRTLLGDPPFAEVVDCRESAPPVRGRNLCVRVADSTETPLVAGVRDAIRWGGDSVAWYANGGIVIRPLGPGSQRRLTWERGPGDPRGFSYFRGSRL